MSTPNSNIKWPHVQGDKRPFFGPDLALQPPTPWTGPWEQTDTKSRKRRRDEDEKAVTPPQVEPEPVFDYSNTTHAFYLAQQAHLARKVRVTPALLANQNSQHFRISDIGDHFTSWLSVNLHWLWEEYVVRAVHWRRAKGTVDAKGGPRHCKHIDAAQRVKLIWLKQDAQRRKLHEQNAHRRALHDDDESSGSSFISNDDGSSDSSSDSDSSDYNPPRAQMPIPQVLPAHLIPTPVPRPVRSLRPSTGPPRPTFERTQTSNAFAAALKTDRMPKFPVRTSTSTDTEIVRQHPSRSTPASTKTSSAFAATLKKARFSTSPVQSNTSTPTGIAGQNQGSVPEEASVQQVTVGQSAPSAPSAQSVDDSSASSSRPATGPTTWETPATETAKPETCVESSNESGSEAESESPTDEPKSEPSPWRNVFGNPGLWLDPRPVQNTGLGNSILAKKRPTASAAQSNPADIPTVRVGENPTKRTGDVLPAQTETTQAAQTGVPTASTPAPQTEPLQIQPPQTQPPQTQPPQTQPRRSARLEQLQQTRTEASQSASQTDPYAPASQTIPSQPAAQTEATRSTELQQSLPAQSQPPSNQHNDIVPQPPPGFFPCPRCTYHNAVTDTWCTACGTLFSNFTSIPEPAQQIRAERIMDRVTRPHYSPNDEDEAFTVEEAQRRTDITAYMANEQKVKYRLKKIRLVRDRAMIEDIPFSPALLSSFNGTDEERAEIAQDLATIDQQDAESARRQTQYDNLLPEIHSAVHQSQDSIHPFTHFMPSWPSLSAHEQQYARNAVCAINEAATATTRLERRKAENESHAADEATMHDFKIDLIHKRFADGEQRFRSWWNTSSMSGAERAFYKRAIREINADALGWHYRGSEVRPMDTRVDPLRAIEDAGKLARWRATVERLREAGLGVPENIKGWYGAKPRSRHRTWWELERLDAGGSGEEEPLTEEQRLMILAVDREALVAAGLDTPENLPNWDGMTEGERDQVLRDWESLEEQRRLMGGGE